MENAEYEYLFHQGTLYKAYEYLGCVLQGQNAVFRLYAPKAKEVFVTGDFNGWTETPLVARRGGIWEGEVKGVRSGDEYKFVVCSANGRCYKSDPYAKQTNTRQYTNSIASKHDFVWTDGAYIRRRNRRNVFKSPMNIYEAHIGSWKKGLSYREFADRISVYLTDMGYNYLELMGISEYPLDDSWGYQVTGYFSPTRRYGDNADFAYLVDKLHSAGIGVIVDWVPGHFPRNEEGLFRFDGSELYEVSGAMGEHKRWGTCCFDYSKNEVRSFLISSAMMWLSEYHVDGLRVDAVASMLYLDYDRTEWTPNAYGGKENIAAIEFLRQLNYAIHKYAPGTFTIAEESTAWKKVTGTENGGLGFDFKWNMGWMHDTLVYLSADPLFRKYAHDKMTFSITYAFEENFILPISHDEVVYGKRSLLNKAGGGYEDKFGATKAYLAMMYFHPGKKLLFMGSELGQFDEWDHRGETGWGLLEYEAHARFKEYVRALNRIYCKYKPLFADEGPNGFEWKIVDDRDNDVFVIERKYDGESLVVAASFSPVYRKGYHVPLKRRYRPLLISDNDDKTEYLGDGNMDLGGYAVAILHSPKERKQ